MSEEKPKKPTIISGTVTAVSGSAVHASGATDVIGSWSGNPNLRVKVYEVNEPADKKEKKKSDSDQ